MDAGSQTNVPVQFGVPLNVGDLASNERIVVRLSGSRLTVQEDNRLTDRSGAIRHVTVTCIVPSLSAGGTVDLVIGKEFGASDVGASKTVAQLLALTTDAEVEVATNDGTARSAKMRDALGASTTWTKGSAHLRSGLFLNGAVAKEVIGFDPQGADGHLGTEFHVTFYSLDNFTTIDCVRVAPFMTNAFIDQASPGDRHVSCVVTSGIASPVTALSLANTTPAVALTVGAAVSGRRTLTTSPTTNGTFTVNDLGKVVTFSAEFGTIDEIGTDGAACTVIAHSISSGTFTSGNWTKHGLRIPYKCKVGLGDVWHGRTPKYKVLPRTADILGSRMVLNYGYQSAQLSMTANNFGDVKMEAGGAENALQGTNPMRMRLATSRFRGERAVQPTEPEARVFPNWQLTSLLHNSGGFITEAGYDRIFFTTHLWNNQERIRAIDDNTGLNPHWGARPDWTEDDYLAHSPAGFDQLGDISHHEDMNFIPYLLTGRFHYLDSQRANVVRVWYETSITLRTTSGADRWWSQRSSPRRFFWCDRTVAHAYLLTPGTLPAGLLAHTKAEIQTWLDNNWTKAVALYNSSPSGWSLETPAGPPMNVDGSDPLWLESGNGDAAWHPWMLSYAAFAGLHMKEIGALSANGTIFYTSVCRSKVEQFLHPDVLAGGANPTVSRETMMGVATALTNTPPGPYEDWGDIYTHCAGVTNGSPIYSSYDYGAIVAAKSAALYGSSIDIETIRQAIVDWAEGQGHIVATGSPLTVDLSQWSTFATYWRENLLEART